MREHYHILLTPPSAAEVRLRRNEALGGTLGAWNVGAREPSPDRPTPDVAAP
jgi:hypothetical protein